MTLRKLLALLVCLIFWPAFVGAQGTPISSAQQQLEKRIAGSHADVAVAFRTLDGKTEWYFHADDSFHAASTMKVPVMIELYRQVQAGKLKL